MKHRKRSLTALAGALALATSTVKWSTTPRICWSSLWPSASASLGQNHWAAACPLTTGRARSVCDSVSAGGGPGLTAAQCSSVSPSSEAGQACASNQAAMSALSAATSLTISKVVVSGSSATVAFNGSSEVMTLSKQNGKWLITSA